LQGRVCLQQRWSLTTDLLRYGMIAPEVSCE
jgi:hypothetical protein